MSSDIQNAVANLGPEKSVRVLRRLVEASLGRPVTAHSVTYARNRLRPEFVAARKARYARLRQNPEWVERLNAGRRERYARKSRP